MSEDDGWGEDGDARGAVPLSLRGLERRAEGSAACPSSSCVIGEEPPLEVGDDTMGQVATGGGNVRDAMPE